MALVLIWWLTAAANGPDAFARMATSFASPVGYVLLFGWTWALAYHACSGVRHLFWDAGRGFALGAARRTGATVIVASVMLTLILWAAAIV